MAEEGHRSPLAPPTIYGRSDEEFGAATPAFKRISKDKDKTTSKCLVYVLVLIVIVSTVLLVFSSIFLRVETPSIRLNYVTIVNPSYDNSSSAFLNGTLNGEIRIRNTNFGRYEYQWATAVVLYRDMIVGSGGISGGRVRGRGSERFGVTMDVSSARVLDANTTWKLHSDMNLGILELTSYTNISGKVYLLDGNVKKSSTIIMNCTVNFNLTSNALQNLLCR